MLEQARKQTAGFQQSVDEWVDKSEKPTQSN
jgi:hypothetical protein